MSTLRNAVGLLIHNPEKFKIALISRISKTKLSHIVSDKSFLSIQYKAYFGSKIDWKDPKTFNEKLQWLKIHNRNPEYCKLVDKYDVREFIANTIGAEYLIPVLGVWNSFDEIDFNSLPDKFVLKCTHDSGSVVICKDKSIFDIESARNKISKKLKHNLFWHGREWPYKNLKPKIIAEQYMIDSATEELRDYKFFCFNGKVKCFKIDFDRFTNHSANYYTPQGELMHFGEEVCPPDYNRILDMPSNLTKMIELAEVLSSGHPFLRVDFYEVNGKIYFGELTFFPASGLGKFIPEEWDYKLGEWIKLPEKKR